MLKKLFTTSRRTFFIFQAGEGSVRIIKCVSADGKKIEFAGVEDLPFANVSDGGAISAEIATGFRKLGYTSEEIIVSVPRGSVTLRFLKIPSQSPREIEKILKLQAPRYFPYPGEELNSAFGIIRSDEQGYSEVNLVIAHKEVIARLQAFLKALKPSRLNVVMSSYGLVNLYHFLRPDEKDTVLLIETSQKQIELVIARQGQMLFSRSFRVGISHPHWLDLCIDEIKKTRDVYVKEVAKDSPRKVVLLQEGVFGPNAVAILKEKTGFDIEEIPALNNLIISAAVKERLAGSQDPYVHLLGLGLTKTPESLNLVSSEHKAASEVALSRKKLVRLGLSIAAIIILFSLAFARHIQNKTLHLAKLKQELAKIYQESKPLETIENRFRAVEKYSKHEVSSLEVLSELHKIIPEQISLTQLIYEEGSEIVIRGTTPEMKSIFDFVGLLEKSHMAGKFNVKVRYATKKSALSGETVDFEIVCSKGK